MCPAGSGGSGGSGERVSRPEYATTGEGFGLEVSHRWEPLNGVRCAPGEEHCALCGWRRKSYGDTPGRYSHAHESLGGWAGFYSSTVPPCGWCKVVDGKPDWWG